MGQMKKEELLKLLSDYYAGGCKLPSPINQVERTIVLAAEIYDHSEWAVIGGLAMELLQGCGVELDDFFEIMYGVNKVNWPDRGFLPKTIIRHMEE